MSQLKTWCGISNSKFNPAGSWSCRGTGTLRPEPRFHSTCSTLSTSARSSNWPQRYPTISRGLDVVERTCCCCWSYRRGATAARPATTRVTILTGRRMTDLVLPAAVPMETYIDDTVAVLSEVLEDTPADVLGGFDFTAQGVWAFARPGSPPLKLDQSLDDAGVVDGSLLTLVSVSRTERYRPLVEDVIDAIAVLDESPEFDRTALNRFVGAAIPLLTAPVIGMAMRAWWETGRSLWWPLAIGILGIAVLVGSFVANRFYQSGHLAECLLVTTYLLIATAAALAVPLPRGVNSLGAPQVAGAATAVLF